MEAMAPPASPDLRDTLGRPLRNLRVSVTDRCNLRCQYCMPEEEYTWLRRADLLTFEEIQRLVEVFTELGVDKVRLTGGEPLLRRDLPDLVRCCRRVPAVQDLAMTTNGVLLAGQAAALREAGLHRVTVSLDTLRPDRFRALTRRDEHAAVLRGIEAVREAGFPGLKLDTVVIRGVNERRADRPRGVRRATIGAEVRFIEYMDVGGATHWSREQVVSRAEILERLAARYGPIEPIREESSAPAERFRLPDGTTFGDHRLDDDAVLPDLRPEPADGRRHVVPLPLRADAASTSGRRSGTGRRVKSFGPSSPAAGPGAGTAARRSGRTWRRSDTAGSWSRSRGSGRIRASRCTRAAAERRRASSPPIRPALTLGGGVARLLPS